MHAVDVYHTVVACAYSDVVLLDGKWAKLAKGLTLPPNRLRIYSPTELDGFLELVENATLAS
jgi:hypothetical protein